MTIFDTLTPDQWSIARELLGDGVEFIVVGGYAVRAYYPKRKADDLDLLINLEPQNMERLINTISPILARDDPEFHKSFIRQRQSFSVNGVEFLPDYSGYLYHDLLPHSFGVEHREHRVQIIGRSDLLAIKRSKNREKDLADISALEAIKDA